MKASPLAIFLFLVASSSLFSAADWPVYQHDLAHTGLSGAKIDPNALNFAWKAPTGYATPLIVGQSIYATKNGAGSGGLTRITSFDLRTGRINWSYSGNFVFPSQAAYGVGYVVFVGPQSVGGTYYLYVLDAVSGALLYTVAIPEGPTSAMPLVALEPSTGTARAYCADLNNLTCVDLGATSGNIVWTQPGLFGGASIPTLAGDSIILAGPGQYYAFDRLTGEPNRFHNGGVFGGGGVTVAYDSSRRQIYVLEDYSGFLALSAYSYIDNTNITLLWQRTGSEIGLGGSVAIGTDGDVYVSSSTTLSELDPATGTTLRQVTGSFARGITPALTRNVLWAFSDTQTLAYDLRSLSLLRAFTGSRGSVSSTYDSPGAWASNAFVLDYGTLYGSPGFDVYIRSR